jgi:signal transduction histidine kinase
MFRERFTHAAQWAFIVVVVIGYVTGLVTGLEDQTPYTIALTLGLTAVYLYLGLHDTDYFTRYPTPLGKASFFIIALGLVIMVQIILGPNGSWLMSLPLAGTAVEHLRPLWRWPVYLGVMAGLVLPIVTRVTWEIALLNALVFSPAIFFVVVFTQVSLEERSARRRAEKLTAELEAANHQLAAYAAQAEELAISNERNRLAREIHDNLGHYLTVVNVQIRAAQTILTADPAKAQDALTKAQTLTQEGLQAIRQSIAALRESPLEKRSLPEAIRALLAETAGAGIVTEFNTLGAPRPLDPRAELTLYRAAQEGLTNVRKHARASRVDVTLDYTQNTAVSLVIQDNGVGTAVGANSGFGLLGIRERAELLGGALRVQSDPGRGFALHVHLPT